MKPTLQVQFFLENEENASASVWISHKEEFQNWPQLVMMIATDKNQLPVEPIYIEAFDEQRCHCLN